MWLVQLAEVICFFALFIFPYLTPANAQENAAIGGEDEAIYFANASSLEGPTGYIHSPSPEVLNHKVYSIGIHKYILKGTYGIFPNLEIGTSVAVEKGTIKPALNIKYKFLEQSKTWRGYGVNPVRSLCIGANPSGKIKKGFLSKFKTSNGVNLAAGLSRQEIYFSLGRYFPNFHNFNVAAGLHGLSPFMDITGIYRHVMWLAEYYKEKYNFGCRILLSPRIKLDLFMIDLGESAKLDFNNFTFGVSFSGYWRKK